MCLEIEKATEEKSLNGEQLWWSSITHAWPLLKRVSDKKPRDIEKYNFQYFWSFHGIFRWRRRSSEFWIKSVLSWNRETRRARPRIMLYWTRLSKRRMTCELTHVSNSMSEYHTRVSICAPDVGKSIIGWNALQSWGEARGAGKARRSAAQGAHGRAREVAARRAAAPARVQQHAPVGMHEPVSQSNDSGK